MTYTQDNERCSVEGCEAKTYTDCQDLIDPETGDVVGENECYTMCPVHGNIDIV